MAEPDEVGDVRASRCTDRVAPFDNFADLSGHAAEIAYGLDLVFHWRDMRSLAGAIRAAQMQLQLIDALGEALFMHRRHQKTAFTSTRCLHAIQRIGRSKARLSKSESGTSQ